MKIPSPKMRKTAALSAVPLAVLLAGGMVWHGSQAAFTATTSNKDNAWTVGGMSLRDDDNESALFKVDNMVPGQFGQKCLAVTATTKQSSEVRPYLKDLSSTGAVAEHLLLSVEQGTGGSFAGCEGFVSDAGPDVVDMPSLFELYRDHRDFPSSALAWQIPVGDEEVTATKTYRVSWTLDTEGMSQSEINSLQGQGASVELVWEMQSDEFTP